MTQSANDLPADFLLRIFAGFDAVLAGKEHSSIVVAVSGGSDSLALLLLAKAYLKKEHPSCRLIAVTVDHQLRAESAREAQNVAALCRQLDIAHETLCWTGDKPSSGLAAAARNARYDLLLEAARQAETAIILTGHTADDQVETYLMRRERETAATGIAGEGRGLAAMACRTMLQNTVLLCRPLLSIWRDELRAFLRAERIDWVDDPSNENQAYERPRIRQQIKLLDKLSLFAVAQQAGIQRRADNHRVATLLKSKAEVIRLLAGDSLFLPAGWSDEDQAIAPLALAYLLAVMGGQVFLPAMKDCAVLTSWMAEPLSNGHQRKTMHHCVIEKSAKGIIIRRERRNLPVITLQNRGQVLWDGRYELYNGGAEPVTIAALSERQLSAFLREQRDETGGRPLIRLDRAALLSTPAVFRDGAVVGLPVLTSRMPHTSFVTVKRILVCFDKVLSGYDFEVAAVVKALLTMPFNHKYK